MSLRSEHMCCQNCYSLLQRMTVLETNFRTLLSEFKDWHFCAVRGPSECGSAASGQRAEDLREQRAVETHRAGPAEHVDRVLNVSTAERYGQNQQWVRVGAKPKRYATYSSVVSSSTPANIANAKAVAWRSQHRARGNHFQSLDLQNRFEPLQDLNDFPSNSQHNSERTRRFSHSKHPRRATGLLAVATADTLVFGDDSIDGMKSNQKLIVRCEPNITVSELNEKLPTLLAEYRTVKRIIVHVGKNDTRKEESEVLKKDFNDLFTTLLKFNIQSFISGPLPLRGCNRFSRLLALNIWLQKTCRSNGLNFIDNFNLFFGKREFFRRDGLHTNKRGVKFLSENFIFSLCNFSVPPGEDTSVLTPKDTVCTTETQHPPPTETVELSDESHVLLYQLPETLQLHEQSTPSSISTSSSSISTSSSPHLNFPATMEKLVSAGTRLTLSLSASPQVQRKISSASPPQSPTASRTLQPPSSPPLHSPNKELARGAKMKLSQHDELLNRTPPQPQRKRQAPKPPDRQLRSQALRQQDLHPPPPTVREETTTSNPAN